MTVGVNKVEITVKKWLSIVSIDRLILLLPNHLDRLSFCLSYLFFRNRSGFQLFLFVL